MSILDRIEIICGDIREVPSDLIVLKYADGLYGADLAVAERLDINIHVPKGTVKTMSARFKEFAAPKVLYRGVGDLFEFRYNEIRTFASATLGDVLSLDLINPNISTTIHGPGYGLDEREAFESQLNGYLDLPDDDTQAINKLIIVEMDERRAHRLSEILSEMRAELGKGELAAPFQSTHPGAPPNPLAERKEKNDYWTPSPIPDTFFDELTKDLNTAPIDTADFAEPPPAAPTPQPTEKPKLFAAMPFAKKYLDEYHIAFVEAAHAHGFLCERLDLENYTGNVVEEIFKRIRDSAGVVALLNENNPNVFLEIGYAMALEKTVILVAHEEQEVAFDLRGQRRQTYTSIYELREEMTELIGDLKSDGTLT